MIYLWVLLTENIIFSLKIVKIFLKSGQFDFA